jgi:hypothetical protein
LSEQPLTIDFDSRLAVNPNLVLRIEDDDCALLFDPDSGRVQMLNDTAVEIWQRLDGRQTLREVVAGLSEVYEGMGPEADQQILNLVEALAGIGAVGIWEKI